MKKIAVIVLIILFGVTLSWAATYKSMCELHPEECVESNLGKLGEIVKSKDKSKEYRVIAEIKSITSSAWIQFIDIRPVNGKFDGECNFAVFFMLKADGFHGRNLYCDEATAIIMRLCKDIGIKCEDFVHKMKE